MSELLTIDRDDIALELEDSANGITLMTCEYPEPELKAVWATSVDVEGALRSGTPVHENRTITIVVRCHEAAYMRDRVKELQQKVTKLNREGGTLTRVLSEGTPLTFDVQAAHIEIPSDFWFVHRDSAMVTLKFDCRPYGDEEPQTRSDHTETSLKALVFTEADLDGSVPALGKLVIDEDDGDDQMFMAWGMQSRYYNGGTTSELYYEAEELLPQGGAILAARAGASGGTVVQQGTLIPTYQSMLSTAYAAGTVHQQHVGGYRVVGRFYRPSSNAGTVSVALEWAEGDFRKHTLNDAVVYEPDDREGDFTLADLGLVTLSEVAQGDQRWEGRVVAKSSTTGDDLECDLLALFPTEGYGEARAVQQFETPTVFSARDEFDQTAGALSGKTAPVGGVWTAVGGDTTDFNVETTGKTAERTAVSDTALPNSSDVGRAVSVGTTSYAAIGLQVDFKWSALTSGNIVSGLLTRAVDTSNYAYLMVDDGGSGSKARVFLRKVVAASGGSFIPATTVPVVLTDGTYFTVRLTIDAAGRYAIWLGRTGAVGGDPVLTGSDPLLATGGALASGKVGVFDGDFAATAVTRNYDNFLAFVPTVDAAVFASQSLELRHDRVIREDSTGAYWNKVSDYQGNYLKLPPAGREDRTARMIVMTSRGDPDTMPDSAIDNLSGRLTVTPRQLVVPDL